jgi:hypothetical protein
MRGYQMRRHARRMRRYGLQPMIFISPGDRLPDTAPVVLARLAWRYRSELVPVLAGVALALAAWVLHRTHPGWWGPIAAMTVPLATCPVIAGARLGLPTRAERIYAAVAVGVAGGWLAAATAVSPQAAPLPLVLLCCGVVLAIPWWAHRRRRARVSVERLLDTWPDIAKAVGLAGSRVQSAVVDIWGWRARFALARGQTRGRLPGGDPAERRSASARAPLARVCTQGRACALRQRPRASLTAPREVSCDSQGHQPAHRSGDLVEPHGRPERPDPASPPSVPPTL